jgi:hypothetical protein
MEPEIENFCILNALGRFEQGVSSGSVDGYD